MTSLENTLIRISKFLSIQHISYMVIGGVANLAWGVPRTTLDVDITLQVEEEDWKKLIARLRKEKYQILAAKPLEFIQKTRVLPIRDPKGVRVDLIFARLPYEMQALRRAQAKRVGKAVVLICSPEDLIIYKIISDRPKDQMDIRGVVKQSGKDLDRKYLDPIVRELSEVLDKPHIYTFYLECLAA